MTLVSVLVAAYRATYLTSALKSALAQSHHALEVIIVDDSEGSAVRDVVHRLDDPRLRYASNEANLGPAASYARAISEASGSVVGILNDDDIWEVDLVERLLTALEASQDAVLAFADHWVLVDGVKDEKASNNWSQLWKRDTLAGGLHRPFMRLALVDKAVPMAVATLFRPSALEGASIPDGVGGAYDMWLTYRLCRSGAGAIYVPERLAAWRAHRDNLTRVASPRRAEEGANLYRTLCSDQRLSSLHRELRNGYSQALWSVATRNMLSGRRWHAVRVAARAVRHGNHKAALLLPAALAPRRVLATIHRKRQR